MNQRRAINLDTPFPLDESGRPVYIPGDIVGVESKGLIGRLSHAAITPQTRLYHFLLIGDYIQDDDDYEILESIGRGVSIGRLSWYAGNRYDVFRVNLPNAGPLGRLAIERASAFGRMGYDYSLFLRFAGDAIRHSWNHLIKDHTIPRMEPRDFCLTKDRAFICTEFVVASWDLVGVPVIAIQDAPVPAAFIRSAQAGRIIQFDTHDGRPINWRSKVHLYNERRPRHFPIRRHGRNPIHIQTRGRR